MCSICLSPISPKQPPFPIFWVGWTIFTFLLLTEGTLEIFLGLIMTLLLNKQIKRTIRVLVHWHAKYVYHLFSWSLTMQRTKSFGNQSGCKNLFKAMYFQYSLPLRQTSTIHHTTRPSNAIIMSKCPQYLHEYLFLLFIGIKKEYWTKMSILHNNCSITFVCWVGPRIS